MRRMFFEWIIEQVLGTWHNHGDPTANRYRKPSANIAGDIFAATISQVADGSKAQRYQFVIERIEFAEGRDPNDVYPQDANITFKGALSRN
jgi:hypothetical protein